MSRTLGGDASDVHCDRAASAVGFRFDGHSWADELAAAGFEVWAFDFKREVKLSKGTHLMHLQEGRRALYRDTLAFLGVGDAPSAGAC